MIQTIENKSRITKIIYTPKFSAICEIGKAPFHGTMVIEYLPKDKLLEFESFEEWLLEISNYQVTIESYCRLVFDTLVMLIDPINLKIETKAETQVHAPACAIIVM